MSQCGNAADLVASHIGGQSISRDHKGDKDARDPIVPIAGEKQRALAFLVPTNVLSDKSFQFSPALLRRLSKEHGTWAWARQSLRRVGRRPGQRPGPGDPEDRPPHCLSPSVLTRLQNQELQSDPNRGQAPGRRRGLPVADRRDLRRAERPGRRPGARCGKPRPVTCSTIRRNLQREYLRRLSTDRPRLVPGLRRRLPLRDLLPAEAVGSYPADARALAPVHLKEIGEKISKVLRQGRPARRHLPGPLRRPRPEDRQGPQRRDQLQRALIDRG